MSRLISGYANLRNMRTLKRSLPHPNALVAFEATARHLSITRAADELALTQAAVSRKIKGLEEDLGVALFRRLHRALRLTAEGERLHAAVGASLWRIAETAEALREQGAPAQVSLQTTIAFAAFWLMPRLPEFRAAYPEVSVRLSASDEQADLAAEGLDAAVRFGAGRWPGLAGRRLMAEEVFPVCSPGYLARNPELRTPEDLYAHTLLHLDVSYRDWMDWGDWFRGLDLAAPAIKRGLRFNTYIILVQAATAGEGVALGWRRLVQDMLRGGSLVQPLAASRAAGGAYHLVWPEATGPTPETRCFLDWIQRAAEE